VVIVTHELPNPQKIALIPVVQEAWLAQVQLLQVWSRKNLLLLLVFGHWTVQPIRSHYTTYAVRALIRLSREDRIHTSLYVYLQCHIISQ